MATITVTEKLQLRPTGYFLDKLVAHKMSSLTECGAPELTLESDWLNTFILNNLSCDISSEKRSYLFNLIRLAEGAFVAYREARSALINYVATPSNVISPYFRSLLFFEVCLSQLWQGCELYMKAGRKAGIEDVRVFTRADNSSTERLWKIHTQGFKHMATQIEAGRIPTSATATVWITNHGLEGICESGLSSLSFNELVEELVSLGELAGKMSRFES